jgi:hypothetical protein
MKAYIISSVDEEQANSMGGLVSYYTGSAEIVDKFSDNIEEAKLYSSREVAEEVAALLDQEGTKVFSIDLSLKNSSDGYKMSMLNDLISEIYWSNDSRELDKEFLGVLEDQVNNDLKSDDHIKEMVDLFFEIAEDKSIRIDSTVKDSIKEALEITFYNYIRHATFRFSDKVTAMVLDTLQKYAASVIMDDERTTDKEKKETPDRENP